MSSLNLIKEVVDQFHIEYANRTYAMWFNNKPNKENISHFRHCDDVIEEFTSNGELFTIRHKLGSSHAIINVTDIAPEEIMVVI